MMTGYRSPTMGRRIIVIVCLLKNTKMQKRVIL